MFSRLPQTPYPCWKTNTFAHISHAAIRHLPGLSLCPLGACVCMGAHASMFRHVWVQGTQQGPELLHGSCTSVSSIQQGPVLIYDVCELAPMEDQTCLTSWL